MAFWSVREELSQANRLRRSYYELLRDQLDQFIISYALTESYEKFCARELDYPFVEKRELKPRARIPGQEYECQNAFLLVFVEDCVPVSHKKYIRFYDQNRTTKTNLLQLDVLPLESGFDRNWKNLEDAKFYGFLKDLLPVDYALMIQRDPTTRHRDRYILSHFHVRIDWPIAEAAEDLGRALRYISKDLYEKGDKQAEDMQKKFFEYYGVPAMAGGRRTAAAVAAQYLKRIPCISTVYVGSSESRSLIRISERGTSKAVLLNLTDTEVEQVAAANTMQPRTFRKNYVVAHRGKSNLCIFQVTYVYTDHARPPDDGKLREINTDVNWLTVGAQHILPKPGVWKYPPLPLNFIYS